MLSVLHRGRRASVVAAAVTALTLLGAAPVLASHDSVTGRMEIYRSGQIITTYQDNVACSSNDCRVALTLPKRDYNRFVRWCAGAGTRNERTVLVTAGQSSGVVTCFGPSGWQVRLVGFLVSGGNSGTHDVDVFIRLQVFAR